MPKTPVRDSSAMHNEEQFLSVLRRSFDQLAGDHNDGLVA